MFVYKIENKKTKIKNVMKLRIVLICSVLFVLCLSVSLVYAFWTYLPGVITYGIIALIVYSTRRSQSLDYESSFEILFMVIVVFASFAVLTCVGGGMYALFTSKGFSESVSDIGLECVEILCMPFICVAIESAAILTLRDTKDCQRMR